MKANRTLWNEYRATWKVFARETDRLQACTEIGDQAQIESARAAVEQARVAHNIARDRLAERLADGLPTPDTREQEKTMSVGAL
ncbi:MAG TPA: hypothetical protein VKB79_28605 [Bryobacteraceae bacterium]|nr:hypothetical protein [Bryobacteraceae bacterium]